MCTLLGDCLNVFRLSCENVRTFVQYSIQVDGSDSRSVCTDEWRMMFARVMLLLMSSVVLARRVRLVCAGNVNDTPANASQ